jgi:allantoin racemase
LRLLLVNPNTDRATTDAMVAIARAAAPLGSWVEGVTVSHGAMLITNEAALSRAAEAVVDLITPQFARPYDGVVVGAFGDPGLCRLREVLSIPVTGLAEAGMAEGAAYGPFVVVTTTPDLVKSIDQLAVTYGHQDTYRGVHLTRGDPRSLSNDQPRLVDALRMACTRATSADVKAIVIGGGPLAEAARSIQRVLRTPIVEPVPAAIRLGFLRAG